MLKQALRDIFPAYRSSHRSVPESSIVSSELTLVNGFDHASDTPFVAPYDGIFVIQIDNEIGETNAYLVVRKGVHEVDISHSGNSFPVATVVCKKGDVLYPFIYASTTERLPAYIRFYPYVGEQ